MSVILGKRVRKELRQGSPVPELSQFLSAIIISIMSFPFGINEWVAGAGISYAWDKLDHLIIIITITILMLFRCQDGR